MDNKITIDTDIKVALPRIGVKMQQILGDCSAELDAIIERAVASFDFEKLLTEEVNAKLHSGISEAMREIDLKDDIKAKLWDRINSSLSGIKF